MARPKPSYENEAKAYGYSAPRHLQETFDKTVKSLGFKRSEVINQLMKEFIESYGTD